MSLIDAWSWSRYELYALCPFKFKCEVIDKRPKQQSVAMARGNTIHIDLAKYVRGDTDVMPAAVTTQFQKKLVQDIREHDDKLVEQQWGFDRHWNQTAWFKKAGLPAPWLRSILDVALLYDDLVGEAIDWKTGKQYEANEEQMELFALSFMRKFRPATDVITRLVYVDAGAETISEYKAADQEKMIAKWEKKVAPMFEDELFLPRPNDKCRFCDHSKSKGGPCRFG